MDDLALIITLFVAVIILLFMSSLFSCADMAFAVVNQLALKKKSEDGSKTALRILKFAENYDTTITTVLFSNNLVNIAATSLATLLASIMFEGSDLAITISSLILLLLLLVFGEIIPKVIGRNFSYRMTHLLIYPLMFFQIIFFPFVWVARMIANLFVLPLKRKSEKKEELISDDELQEMVDTIEKEGVIDEEQGDLLRSAIDFKDTEAYEIMTPRIDMYAIDIDDDIKIILSDDDLFLHSRIPVYQDTIDNIVGVISTKVLLRKMLAHESIDIKTLMKTPHFVPRSMGISEILRYMKKTKNHIVIVRDEFGGVDGLLTMEDILEELVGDIWDEMDEVKEQYKIIKKNQYEVDGSMNIEDFFDLVGLDRIEEKDYSTVGGWCLDILQRFAKIGDKFKYENLKVEIMDATEFTVEKIYVRVSRKKKQ